MDKFNIEDLEILQKFLGWQESEDTIAAIEKYNIPIDPEKTEALLMRLYAVINDEVENYYSQEMYKVTNENEKDTVKDWLEKC